MFRRIMFLLATIALVAAVGLAGLWVYGQVSKPALAETPEPASGYSSTHTITVVGQDSVRVPPDVAQVSIGVETSGATVSEAVKQNNTEMEAILAALTEQGIPEKDIQTMNYSISLVQPVETLPQPEGTSTGQAKPTYRVSNMVTVNIRDLTKVGDVIDAVVEAGANNIWGVTFGLDDPEAAQAEARSKAMVDAEARAQALAQLAGVKLGPVMSVSEVVGGTSIPMAVTVERAMGGSTPINAGEVEISYQVQVVYYIEP